MIIRDIIFSYRKNQFIEFLPYFRIQECPDNFPKPNMMHGHHPYFLDFLTEPIVEQKMGLGSYGYRLNEKPDYNSLPKDPIPQEMSQKDWNTRKKIEILYLLNALSDEYFFIYDTYRRAWTYVPDKEHKLSYSMEGYIPPDYEKELKEIKPRVNNGHLSPEILASLNENGVFKETITLNDLLSLYYSTSNKTFKDEYLDACIVFTKAQKLADFDQSASYVFMISAIEALIEIEFKWEKPKKCTCCKNTQYRVMEKYREFLEKYGHNLSKEEKDSFYKTRSKIAHSGKLFQVSYIRNSFVESQEDFEKNHKLMIESIKHQDLRNLTKICFRNFLYKNINDT